MNIVKPTHAKVISRDQAARLLRAAHRAFWQEAEGAGEHIGWMLSAMRESHHARRLKVDFLLRAGNFDSADALLARSLLRDKTDHPLMRWRYALSMFLQGRLPQADREIRQVLAMRPKHCGALVLAAEIAAARGQARRAVSLLVMANDERPKQASLQRRLVQAMLDAGLIDRAARMLEGWPASPPVMQARVLWAQHRCLEAIEVLQQACGQDAPAADRQEVLRELIDQLERLGDHPALTAALHKLGDVEGSDPTTALCAARAWLSLGCTNSAAEILSGVNAAPELRRSILQHLIVAQSLSQQPDQARATLQMLARVEHGLNTQTMADIWLRGMLGRMIAEQTDGRRAGADPSLSVLQPLLRDAITALDGAISDAAATSVVEAEVDHTALLRHRATCRRALSALSGQMAEAL